MARLLRASFLLFALIIAVAADDTKQQPAPATPSGQQSSEPQGTEQRAAVFESATVLKATTRLVVVDVVATDKKGPVTDLEAKDFTVLEDGKEQKVRAFSFQAPRVAPPAAAGTAKMEPASATLPDNIFTNVPRYNTTGALNVVLLDALNTTFPHQAYVRQQMIKYLEKMPAGRPVAVYLLGTKLTLLQDFTSDPEALRGVIKTFKGKVSPLLDNASGGPDQELLPPGLADSGLIPADMLQGIMQFEQERVAFQTDQRVTYTLNALNSISRALSGYPGRKNLVWVSEAFPLSIDPNLELTGDIFAGTRNYGPEIGAAADALMNAQIAIYPIDARGLEPSELFSASNSGRDKFGRNISGPRMGTALQTESAALQAAHATMTDMADRTGGKAFYNRNDIDSAIGKSIDDGSTYYTLAYYPDNKNWNGKFRKIKVEVSRHDVKLRYRLGYYAVDPKVFAEQNKNQQATLFGEAMSLDSPVATALKFHAGVVQPSDKTQNKVLVNFALDPHAISFDDQKDGLQHATVDCVVQAYSAKGKLIKTEASTVNASLKPETFNRVMRTAFPCQQYIDLPAGSYYLRLGVRDDRTGLMGTANAKVAITPTAPGTAPERPEPAAGAKTDGKRTEEKKP